MRSLSALGAAAAIAALAFVGCGGTQLDSAKMEDQLQASLSSSLGEEVVAADCPSGVEVEKGTTFKCSVKLEKGEKQVATIEIRNKDADTSVIDLRPANE